MNIQTRFMQWDPFALSISHSWPICKALKFSVWKNWQVCSWHKDFCTTDYEALNNILTDSNIRKCSSFGSYVYQCIWPIYSIHLWIIPWDIGWFGNLVVQKVVFCWWFHNNNIKNWWWILCMFTSVYIVCVYSGICNA